MAPHSSTENTNSPNEELTIPNWINGDYFKEVLEKDVPNYRSIVSFKPIAATAPGENYTSIMIRVLIDVEMVDGTIQNLSYILKTCLQAGEGANFVASMNLFEREKQMYQTHLPAFEKLYKEAGINIQLGPKCLRIEELPERVTFILEDLKQRKFINVDRLKGMDMAHATRVLQKIAEFHAVSAVYHELNGPFDENFMSSFFTEANRPIFEMMGKARMPIIQKAMRTWGLENVEKFIATNENQKQFFDEGLKINTPDPKEFNVLNHGDCWSNNLMFNYKDNGEVDEMLFVDFQIGKWGTPAQDLWYFIVTSPQNDIKIKEFEHFIYIYHTRLVECLQKLNYTKNIPTLKEMQILMLKYYFWGIFTLNGTLTVVLFPSDKDANMENMFKMGPEADEFNYKLYTNPIYVAAAKQLYEFFELKGFFEIFNKTSRL